MTTIRFIIFVCLDRVTSNPKWNFCKYCNQFNASSNVDVEIVYEYLAQASVAFPNVFPIMWVVIHYFKVLSLACVGLLDCTSCTLYGTT